MSKRPVGSTNRSDEEQTNHALATRGGGRNVVTACLTTGAAVTAALASLASTLAAAGQMAAAVTAIIAIAISIVGALAVAAIFVWRQR
jgi:hypothetical protein